MDDTRSLPLGDPAARLLGRLLVLAPRLMEVMEIGAQEYGLTQARGRVLWWLRASGPVVMRALSDALAVAPRTVTGLIDSLEADGWVERSPHPTDRRATVIALTPAAEEACARLDEMYRGLARDLADGLADRDIQASLAVVDHLAGRLDEAVASAMTADDRLLPMPHGPLQLVR
ncbi:MAG: MarR family winged helix-turn-helix transcriptional regulator [Streptosporangiaceae bacterium]